MESHAPMDTESPNPHLQARIRFSLLVLLFGNAVFFLVDIFARESFDPRIWPSRTLQVVAVAAYFVWLRKERARGILIAGTLLLGIVVYATMTFSWSIRSGAEGIRPAILATAFSTAALIPWGTWAQAASAALGGTAMLIHALATVGFAGFPPGPDAVATFLALGVSVLVARELQRQRDVAGKQHQKRAAAIVDLQESESRFRGAFDNAPIGMALVGSDGRWLKVNRRICDIVGYSERELLASDFQTITHPDDLDLDLELLRDTLAGRRDGYQMDKRYIHKRGHVVWVLLAVSLIRRPDGSPNYFVSQVEDVTSRVKAEQALAAARDEALRASQTKSEFLATMSHELRTPLGAIIGMADILSDTDLQEEQREFVDVIHRSSVALLDIINDVLDLSRIESGRIQLHESDIDVRKLVQESAELFRAEMQRRGLGFDATVDASIPQRVRGDEARLRQILINLIGNAVKFTHAGRVDVEVRGIPQDDGRIAIHGLVRDTGIGIAAEQQQRIFDAFVQADSTTSRAYGGSGLGLAICRHLTKWMGGGIEIESEVGVGTAVRFVVVFDEIAAASNPAALPDEPGREEP